MGGFRERVARKVAVIGSGSWGTAATGLVGVHADEVVLWSFEPVVADGINETRHNPHQLTSYEVMPCVRATTSLAEAVGVADAILLVVPSAHLRRICEQLSPYVDSTTPVLVLTKGVERDTGCLMVDVVEQTLGGASRIAALSGPNHAEEISEGTISAAVVAAEDPEVARYFQQLVASTAFRTYVSEDVRGVEVCAAVKNVIALACGIASALGAGDNTLAALMTRGLAEMTRVAVAMGADPLTCMGLAGMGDLVVTCTSQHSRNRTFGEAFASGETLEAYQARTGMIVEGAEAARSVLQLARARAVEVPITLAVHQILYEGRPLADAVDMLLGRSPRDEFYGVAPGARSGEDHAE